VSVNIRPLQAITQQRQKNIKHRTTANKNTTKPSRIFHAALRPMCLKKRMEYARWQDAYEISYGAIDKANCALRLRITALCFIGGCVNRTRPPCGSSGIGIAINADVHTRLAVEAGSIERIYTLSE
jgi:hypothetical protein